MTKENKENKENVVEIPKEVRRWNWGAFFLSWIWGLGNNVYIALLALLVFIPILGWIVAIVMMFILGAKGGAWAWKKGHWRDVKHFLKVQRTWALVGLLVWIIGAFAFNHFFSKTMRNVQNSVPVKQAMRIIKTNHAMQNLLGKPIKLDGYVFGTLSPRIKNHLFTMEVKGSKADAAVRFTASNNNPGEEDTNGWVISSLNVSVNKKNYRLIGV
tara:strand:+ start:59 stop:700 length:642 start_codon:yes stop_codon:yes gene_type:complete